MLVKILSRNIFNSNKVLFGLRKIAQKERTVICMLCTKLYVETPCFLGTEV